MLPRRARVDLGAMAIKGILCIPQRSINTGASPSNCFVSYPGHSLEESYPSAKMQSVYSTPTTECATMKVVGGVLPLCRDAVVVYYTHNRLRHHETRWGSLTPLQRCSCCILHPQPFAPP